MRWEGTRQLYKGRGPTCVLRILRDEGNNGPGLQTGSLGEVSVGVLLSVCRAYKSGQKVGGGGPLQ